MEQLLRLHLRVVDDGKKRSATSFHTPPLNANAETLVEYVELGLGYADGKNTTPKNHEEGVEYAVNLAREFKKSVRIVSGILPKWDENEPLVGDVLIMERELSCQFFLITCRLMEAGAGSADGRLDGKVLSSWERLLFTRDFHDKYYNLKGTRDNFEELFEACLADPARIADVVESYLAGGFRPGLTDGLQSLVRTFVEAKKERILNEAFYWWKSKMIYAIYKYEAGHDAKIRDVMKGTVSVEHILPQEWQWEWIDGCNSADDLSHEQREAKLKEIGSYINGLGNLLILTPGENTSVGNNHPADKIYNSTGGSYQEHDRNRERWRSSAEWPKLIRERGEEIFEFMLKTLIDDCNQIEHVPASRVESEMETIQDA